MNLSGRIQSNLKCKCFTNQKRLTSMEKSNENENFDPKSGIILYLSNEL